MFENTMFTFTKFYLHKTYFSILANPGCKGVNMYTCYAFGKFNPTHPKYHTLVVFAT